MSQTKELPGFVQKQLEESGPNPKLPSSDPKVILKITPPRPTHTSSLVPGWEPLIPVSHPAWASSSTPSLSSEPGLEHMLPSGPPLLLPRIVPNHNQSCLLSLTDTCHDSTIQIICVLLCLWAVFFHLPLSGHMVSEDDSLGG